MHFYPVNPASVPSCADCGFLGECGGLEGDAFAQGCFQRCDTYCRLHGCDVVCPSSPLLVGELFGDVGGICVPPRSKLISYDPTDAPVYVPQINNGYRRIELLCEPWITVPLYAVAGRDRNQRYQVKFKSGEELRRALRVSPQTKIIITSVTPDRFIEDFWAEHKVRQIPEQLSALDVTAMTVPNFSFMRDVPRTNSLYNLSRIFRAAEAISAAGISTILHLNASTRRDWKRWRDVLREQSHINSICVEFQTGTHDREIGDRYFSGLVELQDSLGRRLHPFALAGGSRIVDLNANFDSFTIIDATPFMKTVKYWVLIRIAGGWKSRLYRMKVGASLSNRLKRNIESRRVRFLQRIGRDALQPGQQLLPVRSGFNREQFVSR